MLQPFKSTIRIYFTFGMEYSEQRKLNSLKKVGKSFCFILKKQSDILSLAYFSLVLKFDVLNTYIEVVLGFSYKNI